MAVTGNQQGWNNEVERVEWVSPPKTFIKWGNEFHTTGFGPWVAVVRDSSSLRADTQGSSRPTYEVAAMLGDPAQPYITCRSPC